MSEQTAEATATGTDATTEQQVEQPKPSETVDFWKQKAREQEKRAKENAEAAKRLAEIEDAQKSEAQKAADKVAQAEQRAIEAEARALRREIAIEHKLSKDDSELLDSLTDETAMRRLAERLAAASEDKRTNGNHVPGEGNNPQPSDDPVREFARGLFDRANAD
jgi:hypothetical protein